MYDNRLDPPYDIKGRVIPIIGSNPNVIDILCICWNNSTDIIPAINSLSLSLYDLLANPIILISKYIINPIRINAPISPKFDANTANIKSVCISGKYIGV